MEQDDGEEARCRYCFDGADAEELIAPCDCSGSQRYVHLSCLHKWQAHRLLEAASTERHHPNPKRFEVCEVCHGKLRTPPPTSEQLLHLVRPDSGAALVAALGEPTLLVSVRAEMQLSRDMPPALRMMLALRGGHWTGSVFLLYERQAAEASDGSDCILGVNLSREVEVSDDGDVTGSSAIEVLPRELLQDMIDRVRIPAKDGLQQAVAKARAAGVVVKFFIGGPCAPKEMVAIHSDLGEELEEVVREEASPDDERERRSPASPATIDGRVRCVHARAGRGRKRCRGARPSAAASPSCLASPFCSTRYTHGGDALEVLEAASRRATRQRGRRQQEQPPEGEAEGEERAEEAVTAEGGAAAAAEGGAAEAAAGEAPPPVVLLCLGHAR